MAQSSGGWDPPTGTGGSWWGGHRPADGWTGGGDKPGVIPLRPLTAGEILDGAFATLRQNPAATLGMSAAVTASTQLAASALVLLGRGSTAGLTVAGIAGAVLQLVATLALSAGLTVVVADAVLGRRPTVEEVWRRVQSKVWSAVGLSLLVGLIVGILAITVVGIPVAVYAYVALSLAVPALMLENQPPRAALLRSRELVRGAWWRTFGTIVLATFVTFVMAALIELVLGAVGLSGGLVVTSTGIPAGRLLLGAVAGTVANSLVAPVRAGVVALIYVDRRMRTEGLDLTLRRAARQGGAPA